MMIFPYYSIPYDGGIYGHEPRGLKPSGLHLGASRCNRLHDGSPRDIDSGVPIIVTGVATLHTTKRGLGLAVRFRTVSTSAALAGTCLGKPLHIWYTFPECCKFGGEP